MSNSLQEKIDKFASLLPDEEIVTEIPEGAIVFKELPKGKKHATTYVCEKCNRKKTVRYVHIPVPASCGKCPRCKEGTMYGEFISEHLRAQ